MTPISQRLGKALSAIPSIVGAGVFLFIMFLGLKGCIVRTWKAPSAEQAFSAVGANGATFYLVLFPDQRVISALYTSDGMEASLSEWRGAYGTHLIWRLWHLDGPKVVFGYRIYPSGFHPVRIERRTLRNFKMGSGNSAFPREGITEHEVVLFGQDTIFIGGVTLERTSLPEELRESLTSILEYSPGP